VPRGKDPGYFDPDAMPEYPSSRTDPFVQLAILAADEALADAHAGAGGSTKAEGTLRVGDVFGEAAADRCAVCVGAGIGALRSVVEAGQLVSEGKARKLSPFFVPKVTRPTDRVRSLLIWAA
jgi:3-oxoacyl-[acyl-carrier-protein] synthase II